MNLEIKTNRMILLPPSKQNILELHNLMKNSVDTAFLSWEPHSSLDETESLIDSLINSIKLDKGYHWVIFYNAKIVGFISLIDVKRVIRTWIINRAELSYWISNEFTGNGFATEAALSVIDFGFKNLSLNKIIIAHTKENIKSKIICKKLGFNQYSYETNAFCKFNVWYDLIWYEKFTPYL